MPKITFITTCMGRLDFLKRSLPTVATQPDSSCVVVDYSCPERSGQWVKENFPNVQVVHVEGQSRFNQSKARNAGLAIAIDPWICFFDCDILFDPTFMKVVAPTLTDGFYYRPHPLTDFCLYGTLIFPREQCRRAGGWDETFQGWGEADNDIVAAMEFLGLKKRTYPADLVNHIPHDDQRRTQFYDTKNKFQNQAINFTYRFIKWDLSRLSQKFLPLPMRQQIYDKVKEMMHRPGFGSPNMPPQSLEFAIGVPVLRAVNTDRVLKYKFRGRKTPPPPAPETK